MLQKVVRSEPSLRCTHCGDLVPEQYREDREPDTPIFCCGGCEAVYFTIHELGLANFYELRQDNSQAQPVGDFRSEFEEFDSDYFIEHDTEAVGEGLRRVTFLVRGIHCAACVWLLEKLPRLADGLEELRADFSRETVTLVYDPEVTTLANLANSLERLGYRPYPYRQRESDRIARQEDRDQLTKIAVTGAIFGNVMLISAALYSGFFSGIDASYWTFFRVLCLLLAIPATLWGGETFFRGAIQSLRHGFLHMDLPISVGLIAGLVGGAVNVLRGAGEVYFDSVTALVFFLLVGRFLQRRQQRQASLRTEVLRSLTAHRARRLNPNTQRWELVPTEAIEVGEQLESWPGEVIPVDGTVIRGESTVDVSFLTGESRPLNVSPEVAIYAGSTNLSGEIRFVATQTGEETRIGQIARSLEEYAQKRPRVVQLADRWAGVFVKTVFLLAALTMVGWSIKESVTQGFENAIALLIVSCPCALALATPLAVAAALGKAARHGYLLKSGELFETLKSSGRIWFDKTGTLTQGRFELVDTWGDLSLLPRVAALELTVNHPIAQAISRAISPANARPTRLNYQLGRGVEGEMDGIELRVGSPRWFRELGCNFHPALEERLSDWARRGITPVLAGTHDRVTVALGLADPIDSSVPEVVSRLKAQGWKLGILSGDDPSVVQKVATQLGIEDAYGGLTPEQKADHIETNRSPEQSVVMVGDGVNDAPAMSASDVGLAVHGGAEAALEAADGYFNYAGLSQILPLLEASKRVVATIRRGLLFSAAYNAVGASLAIAGVIHPLTAAILMPLSSLTVTLHAYRSKIFLDSAPLSRD